MAFCRRLLQTTSLAIFMIAALISGVADAADSERDKAILDCIVKGQSWDQCGLKSSTVSKTSEPPLKFDTPGIFSWPGLNKRTAAEILLDSLLDNKASKSTITGRN